MAKTYGLEGLFVAARQCQFCEHEKQPKAYCENSNSQSVKNGVDVTFFKLPFNTPNASIYGIFAASAGAY
jgi:hypothetical protein